MKRLLLLLLLLSPLFGFTQEEKEIILLNHAKFMSMFAPKEKTPKCLVYEVSEGDKTMPVYDRLKIFTADPLVPNSNYNADYLKSGYDRGHMMSAASNKYSKIGMKECFYFTNITPQTIELNRGYWKNLEFAERVLADKHGQIKVLCGNIDSKGTIGEGNVNIPLYCYKVIITPKSQLYKADTLVYIFPNSKGLSKDMEDYKYNFSYLQNMILEYEKIDINLTDALNLYDCKSESTQNSYMKKILIKRINEQYVEIIDIDNVIKSAKNMYNNDIKFKEAIDRDNEQSKSLDEYLKEKISANNVKLSNEKMFLTLSIKSLSTQSIFTKFAKTSSVSPITLFEICPRCHLPTFVPRCPAFY